MFVLQLDLPLLRAPSSFRRLLEQAALVRSLLRHPALRILASPGARLAVGLTLLAALALARAGRAAVFVDEADNVLSACLLADGQRLYGDVFSHHFPLPYELLALLGEGGACSVQAARLLGLVALTLAGAAFAWIARNALAPAALLVLALSAPAYFLQLYLAETFVAAGLILCLALLTERGRRVDGAGGQALRVIALATLAWSSPVGLMMASIVAVLMVVAARGRRAPVVAACAAAFLVWPALLLVQGTLLAFVEQAVLFNTRVYSAYLAVELTNPLSLLGATLLFAQHRFTFVVDWLAGKDTEATIATYAVFLEALLLVLLGVLVARRRDESLFRLGACLLLPLAVAREGFHASPFIALASFACVQLLPATVAGRMTVAHPILIRGLAVAAVVVALRIHLLFVVAEPAAANALAHSLEPEPRVLQHAGPGDTILYLPIAPQGYLAHDRRPGSFYPFFLPWQADVPGAEDRLIADIERNRVAVIVLDQETAVWGKYRLRDYAPRLVAHVQGTYRPVDGGDRRRARIFVRNGA